MTTSNTNRFITKEGVEVQVGQIWRDLDKRMRGRVVEVVALGNGTFEGKVRIRSPYSSGTTRWLSVSRMHKHSTGWRLVPAETYRLSRLLTPELRIYSCVLLAEAAIMEGRSYHEIVALLRVDADKLRMHSAALYELVR